MLPTEKKWVTHALIHLYRRPWHGLNTTPFFKLSVYKFIFNNISLFFLLFHLFFLVLTCSCQYSYNFMLTTCMCRTYIDTNNPQGMKLRRFKNHTPARFEYIYCTSLNDIMEIRCNKCTRSEQVFDLQDYEKLACSAAAWREMGVSTQWEISTTEVSNSRSPISYNEFRIS